MANDVLPPNLKPTVRYKNRWTCDKKKQKEERQKKINIRCRLHKGTRGKKDVKIKSM